MTQRKAFLWLLIGGILVLLAPFAVRIWLAPTTIGGPIINITYPYVASAEREGQIRSGIAKVRPGEFVAQVKDVLGTPDEVRPLYEPQIKNPRCIGTTYWYFLEKKSADSNLGTKAVRISFGLNDRVMRVDHWGLDDGNAAEPAGNASQDDVDIEVPAEEKDTVSFGIPNSFSGRLSAKQDQKVPEALRGAFYIESLRDIKAEEITKELKFKTQVAEEVREEFRYIALRDFRHVQFSNVVSGQMIVIERYRVISEQPKKP